MVDTFYSRKHLIGELSSRHLLASTYRNTPYSRHLLEGTNWQTFSRRHLLLIDTIQQTPTNKHLLVGTFYQMPFSIYLQVDSFQQTNICTYQQPPSSRKQLGDTYKHTHVADTLQETPTSYSSSRVGDTNKRLSTVLISIHQKMPAIRAIFLYLSIPSRLQAHAFKNLT